MFHILPKQVEAYTETEQRQVAQQLVEQLSKAELAYVLQSIVPNASAIQNPSAICQNILDLLRYYSKQNKNEGGVTFADLLWETIREKSSAITTLTKESINNAVIKRGIDTSRFSFGLFDNLTDDATKYILSKNNTGSILTWMSTCKKAFLLFRQTEIAQQALSEFKNVLNDAAVGRWNKVFAAINACPDLLLCHGTTDYCRRYTYSGFIYHIFLKNCENNETSHQKMLDVFEKLPNGKAEMTKQYFEVFPGGRMLRSDWDINTAKKLLNDFLIILFKDNNRAISLHMSGELKNAYENYQSYLQSKMRASTEGLVCDPQFFIYIINKYKNFFKTFTPKQKFIYGTMIRDRYASMLPTGLLKAMCQGLESVVEQEQPFLAEGCVFLNGQEMLPLTFNNISGRFNTIDSYSGSSISFCAQSFKRLDLLENYIAQMQKSMDKINHSFTGNNNKNRSRCSIM